VVINFVNRVSRVSFEMDFFFYSTRPLRRRCHSAAGRSPEFFSSPPLRFLGFELSLVVGWFFVLFRGAQCDEMSLGFVQLIIGHDGLSLSSIERHQLRLASES
jgi:hypothetical protein